MIASSLFINKEISVWRKGRSSMIRYATIGTSGVTEKFIRGCRLTGRYQHAAVYSRTEEKGRVFAERTGCNKVVTSLEQLAQDPDIDAVYIASPNGLHVVQSKFFLEHGKHVICEKPLVTASEEYKKLKQLADEKNVIYMEAIVSYHGKYRKSVKQALQKVGNIGIARINFCQLSNQYENLVKGNMPNIFNPALGGGALMDLGVYCVYGAVDLLGMPKNIKSSASFLTGGVNGSGCAIFDYDTYQAVLTYSLTGKSMLGSEIIGDQGTLKIGMISKYTDVTLVKDGTENRICDDIMTDQLMSGEAEHFADFIENRVLYEKDYQETSEICRQVHTCMDWIRDRNGLL